jgi:hypothetical protein
VVGPTLFSLDRTAQTLLDHTAAHQATIVKSSIEFQKEYPLIGSVNVDTDAIMWLALRLGGKTGQENAAQVDGKQREPIDSDSNDGWDKIGGIDCC